MTNPSHEVAIDQVVLGSKWDLFSQAVMLRRTSKIEFHSYQQCYPERTGWCQAYRKFVYTYRPVDRRPEINSSLAGELLLNNYSVVLSSNREKND